MLIVRRSPAFAGDSFLTGEKIIIIQCSIINVQIENFHLRIEN
jgi:hypothetical protein